MNENLLIFLLVAIIVVFAGLLVTRKKQRSLTSSQPQTQTQRTENFSVKEEPYFYKNEYANNFKANWDMSKEERDLQCKYTLGGLNQKYTIRTPPNEQPIDFKKLFPLNYDG